MTFTPTDAANYTTATARRSRSPSEGDADGDRAIRERDLRRPGARDDGDRGGRGRRGPGCRDDRLQHGQTGRPPVNAGSYVATGTFAGNDNYTAASNTAAIVINRANADGHPDGGKTKILGDVHGVYGPVAGLRAPTRAPQRLRASERRRRRSSALRHHLDLAFTSAVQANYDVQLKTAVKGLIVLYRWDGFLQPINDTAHDLGPMSKFKTGQTIPAKFVLKNAAGAAVQQTGIPTFTRTEPTWRLRFGRGARESGARVGRRRAPVQVGRQQYHYNWSTKGLTAGLYRIFANLADGTAQSVDICLTK